MTEKDKLYADKLRNKALSDYERLDHAINELERQICDDCVYTDIADWEEITGTGKVKPVLWCEKYNNLCSDVTDCKYKAESNDEKDVNCTDLCESCNTKGCIFQSGIARSHCDFYKTESEDKE